MRPENAHDAKGLDEHSRSPVEDREGDTSVDINDTPSEEAVLIVADECVNPAEYRGILSPELRTRLDAMTRDYARILTRIDRMVDRPVSTNPNSLCNAMLALLRLSIAPIMTWMSAASA